MSQDITWEDADMSSYAADATVINGYLVTVCLDDEGPLNPAYYWDITLDSTKSTLVIDGWCESVESAKTAAVAAAKSLTPTQEGTTVKP